MTDLQVAPNWVLPLRDVQFRYAHSSGPGGQNVNKVATKVELRLYLSQTQALSPAQKQRLAERYPSHVTQDGEFLLTSDRFRSQHLNRKDALERLCSMLLSVRRAPRARVKTKPSRAAQQRRLDGKRRQSERKQQRKGVDG